MDAGYEIWYGIKKEDLSGIADMTVEELITKAGQRIGEGREPNRILGEREFFALRRGDTFELSSEWERESLVLYGPKPAEQMEGYGFGVELYDADWDFGPKAFPADLPDQEKIDEAARVFDQVIRSLFEDDLATSIISAAGCWITPYYL